MSLAVASSSETSTGPRLLIRGLDSLYVSFWLDVQTGALDFDDLAFQKEKLRQSRSKDFAEISLGAETFALKPFGRHPYPFLLSNDAFEIRLSEHMRPACHVQFYSEGLWLLGLDALMARFREWCRSCRLVETRPDIVARADWAFDYQVSSIDFGADNFVSRAAKAGLWTEHRRIQTFQFGRGNVVIRVYDKVAEIEQQSDKAWLFDLWGRKDGVWRIEFQVRRNRLDEACIGTVESLKTFQNDLLRELANNHTSLRTPSDDSNRSRWPLHPLWQALIEDIASLPQTGLVRNIDPQMPIEWRLYQQSKSIHGSLKGLGALLALKGKKAAPPELSAVLGALPGLLEPHHSRLDWADDLERRMTGYGLGQW